MSPRYIATRAEMGGKSRRVVASTATSATAADDTMAGKPLVNVCKPLLAAVAADRNRSWAKGETFLQHLPLTLMPNLRNAGMIMMISVQNSLGRLKAGTAE